MLPSTPWKTCSEEILKEGQKECGTASMLDIKNNCTSVDLRASNLSETVFVNFKELRNRFPAPAGRCDSPICWTRLHRLAESIPGLHKHL